MKGVFIDGYIPGEQHFREMDWQSMKRGKTDELNGFIPTQQFERWIGHHLREDAPWSEYVIGSIYDGVVKASRADFCPHDACHLIPIYPRVNHPLGIKTFPTSTCYHATVGTGNGFWSLERPRYGKGLDELLPVLEREYRLDDQRDIGFYLQNLIIVPQTDSVLELLTDDSCLPKLLREGKRPVTCEHEQECTERWMQTADLRSKRPEEYQDFDAFTGVWYSIMDEACDDYRRDLQMNFPYFELHITR